MIFSPTALADKHVVVTGASSGIGRDAAILFAACGGRITLCGRDEARLEAVLASLDGSDHQRVSADLASIASAQETIAQIAQAGGPIAGVFHCAGGFGVRPAQMYNEAHLSSILDGALNGALGIAKACAKKRTMPDGGSIVFMSSVAAIRGRSGLGIYSATKGAIDGLTRSLAAEFAGRRIRVNAITAGAVETPMHDSVVDKLDQAGVEAYRALHPLGFGTPGDVSNLALFLLSEASKWMTGTSIAADGGYSAM